MPSTRNPFSNKNIPSTPDALFALGVSTEKPKDDPDTDKPFKLEMTPEEAALIEEAESRVENVWNRRRLIKWAESFDKDKAWVDQTFDFVEDKIVCKKDELYLDHTSVSVIPPGLEVRYLSLDHTQVSKIPPGLKVDVLWLNDTQVSIIPLGLQVETLYLSGTQVSVIPPGTAIKTIWAASSQTELIASANAQGIEVGTY